MVHACTKSAIILLLAFLGACSSKSYDKVDLCRLGFEHLQQGQNQEAAACFRRALYFDHRYAGAHYGLARVMGRLGQFEEAGQHYDEAIELAPNFAMAYLGRSVIQLERRAFDEARRDRNRAFKLEPRLKPVREGKVRRYHVMGLEYAPWKLLSKKTS